MMRMEMGGFIGGLAGASILALALAGQANAGPLALGFEQKDGLLLACELREPEHGPELCDLDSGGVPSPAQLRESGVGEDRRRLPVPRAR